MVVAGIILACIGINLLVDECIAERVVNPWRWTLGLITGVIGVIMLWSNPAVIVSVIVSCACARALPYIVELRSGGDL